jgi:hypothetical protein
MRLSTGYGCCAGVESFQTDGLFTAIMPKEVKQ